MIYSCCNENRKAAVLGNPLLNGIDYLEVLDHEAIHLSSPRQRTLLVHCLNAVPTNLAPSNVLIDGGESITEITVQWIAPASAPPPQANAKESGYFTSLPDKPKVLVVRTTVAGDFSPYTLRLVNGSSQATADPFQITETLAGFDPGLAEVQFSFKVECGPDFDCAPQPAGCPPQLPSPPPINYLAKDYGSFRSIMLDRINQLLPSWGGSSEADVGVALAEVIAYVGDYLSYQQDAVATEAYLETARSRISLRRHALLVDYRVHDGANARAWIQLQVSAKVFLDHTLTRFHTFAPGMPSSLVGTKNEEAALLSGVVFFEPMQDAVLFPEHNLMYFYTWGDAECCLSQGATEATLLGSLVNLQPGDVLIFQEVVGPQTGNPADADIRHRCAVRITQVATQNGQGQPLVDPLYESGTGLPIVSASQQPTPITEIQWSADDALPFPLCLSATLANPGATAKPLLNVSVALGNVVLADQGLSMSAVPLGVVPVPLVSQPVNPAAAQCQQATPCPQTAAVVAPVRYRPMIPDSPLTQAVPLTLAGSPVTPGIVPLSAYVNGSINLSDADGNVCLLLQATDPLNWPQKFFGVKVSANATPGNIDLSVVYNPSGGAIGVPIPVVLESFSNLSLKTTDPNYVGNNLLSNFITIVSVSASSPAGIPGTTTTLPNTGPCMILDSAGNTYLTVQATSPLAWPALFGVLSQGNQQQADLFNLLVVYNPSSGGVGVQIPIVVEQFDNLTLANITEKFSAASALVTVQSFAEQPSLSLSACDMMNYDPDQALPTITLIGSYDGNSTKWTPKPDLLESNPGDPDFVVEIESDATAYLRFGDNTNGLNPESGTSFNASYRIGNGTTGNIGAESLVFYTVDPAAEPYIQNCTNPLPASGGVDPETTDQIRRRAPMVFMTQERAITMADYVTVTESVSQIDRAVASLRWTGSWYTVFITAEPAGGGNLTPALQKTVSRTVDRYRLAGQDIQLESPQYLPLQITLAVCVDPSYFQADVKQALLLVLGCGILPNGQKAYFYPDNFSFGQTVYLSPIYAATRQVAGVLSVTATVFAPQGVNTNIYLDQGEIPLEPFQIARMDNDPSYPNHGQLTLNMLGGK